ncbi:LacI family DNA-binding transcriptional regulator [Paenibacillus thalictri]|uniref:LacI family DNA-binding transcriptional regulator n=1 Tax=Paenibacillus thalictri TaxID=2527873 RepID=A0A4Q9DP35_9BACL|nr:LacI family DNA-binding transcriptional regulator [Paenibacillus thalictri]TBL76343.1 LacI family DNA-binding transcriptional regulator [Paenibacillus thalictri]
MFNLYRWGRSVLQKNITAHDIANHLGISQSTVSRVFTPGASVSEKTRRRVLEAAELLGYRPNMLARSLITKKTNMIGLVMGDIDNPFYPEVLSKLSGELKKRQYNVLLLNAENDDVPSESLIQFLGYNIEGLVVTDVLLSSSIVSQFAELDIPIVLFNRYTTNAHCHTVCCDNMDGGRRIGEYLLRTGHRRLAFISGDPNTSTSQDREKGFRDALLNEGLHFMTESGGYTYEMAYEAANRLFLRADRPDAIFCANDIMAIGAIDAAKKLGVRVPEDVSIIGFDNIKPAAWAGYDLTTWTQPVDRMIEATIDLLLEKIEEPDRRSQADYQWIKGHLVERNTVMTRNKND